MVKQKQITEAQSKEQEKKFYTGLAWVSFTFFMLSLIPFVSAYALGIPMPSLYDALVEYGMGGFWLAIIVIGIIMWFTLTLGGVSMLSTQMYLGTYLYAMCLGYGYILFSILIFGFAMSWSIAQIFRSLGGGWWD